jgi:hypothetical protein
MAGESVPFFEGFGLGLRPTHYEQFLSREVRVDFVEVISENFMVEGGRPLRVLDGIRRRYPVIMHGVSMSIGSAGGPDKDYLERLKALADRIQPLWVSDHLCWTGTQDFNSHDLLPLPFTEDALRTTCSNIHYAQDVLRRPLVLENPSSYLSYAGDQMSEWTFLAEACRQTGCYLLLDVNNVYVSASNHDFDPVSYIEGIPHGRVRQIHLAGHTRDDSGLLIDTHDQVVHEAVWELYACARQCVGGVATMIERDDNIPPLDDLLSELDLARGRVQAWDQVA